MNNTMNNPESSKQGNKGNWDSKPDRANWADMKVKIKSKWSMLSDSQLEGLENDFDRLPEQIQKTYGYSRQQADQEFTEFKSGLEGWKGMSGGTRQGEQQSKNQKNRGDKSNQTGFGAV